VEAKGLGYLANETTTNLEQHIGKAEELWRDIPTARDSSYHFSVLAGVVQLSEVINYLPKSTQQSQQICQSCWHKSRIIFIKIKIKQLEMDLVYALKNSMFLNLRIGNRSAQSESRGDLA